MSQPPLMADLATLHTTAERIVAELFVQAARFHSEAELEAAIARRIRAAASNRFGHVDELLIESAQRLDRMILSARDQLGIKTTDMAAHLAHLESNGPWLEDLGVPDSRLWDVAEISPGRWAQVNHEHRLASSSLNTAYAAAMCQMRLDEIPLRKMRERYELTFPKPELSDESPVLD